jgi:hypothetical protein
MPGSVRRRRRKGANALRRTRRLDDRPRRSPSQLASHVREERRLVDRILETPHVAYAVPRLQPEVLHRIIQTAPSRRFSMCSRRRVCSRNSLEHCWKHQRAMRPCARKSGRRCSSSAIATTQPFPRGCRSSRISRTHFWPDVQCRHARLPSGRRLMPPSPFATLAWRTGLVSGFRRNVGRLPRSSNTWRCQRIFSSITT